MRSLKAALTLRLLFGGILLLGVAGLAFQWRMRRALTSEFDSGVRMTARSLQALVEWENGKVKMESEADDMPEFNHKGGSSIFLLLDSAGSEIRRSRSLGGATLNLPAAKTDLATFLETTLPDGRRLRCISVPIKAQDDSAGESLLRAPGSLRLVVGRVSKPLEHTLEELRNSLLAAGGISLAVLSGLLLWGVKRGLAPLDNLVQEISRVDDRSLFTRLTVDSVPSELQPIVIRLNELLARLEKVFDREKRFTADVAHELRTPLAELRTLAEVNLLAPPPSAQENALCWEEIQTVVLRMESLSLRLLELARSEQAGVAICLEPVDPAALLKAALERIQPAAETRGIAFECLLSGPVAWNTDPVLLDMIVSNLIGNAAHHAVPDSVCRIELDHSSFRISNRVAGIGAGDLPFFFERFWKKDLARSDGRRHGLGLALVKEAAGLLGGSLEADIEELGQRLTFVYRHGDAN